MGPERVPCPICRGPIHPVAGRCKHCKTDLAALHAGKPEARGALPALGNRTTNEAPVRPTSPGRRLVSRPVLPLVEPGTVSFGMSSPLPSSRLPEARPEQATPPSWPVIVIALSAIAIVLAIGVLAAQLR